MAIRKPPKTKLIAMVHIAKKDLQLDDDNYRLILLRTTGKQSTKDMTLDQLDRVIARLKELGWVPKTKKGKKLSPPSRHKPETEKTQDDLIRALWINLGKMGALKDRSENALQSWIERQTGIAQLKWLNVYQKNKVIEALKLWIKRIEEKGNDSDSAIQ